MVIREKIDSGKDIERELEILSRIEARAANLKPIDLAASALQTLLEKFHSETPCGGKSSGGLHWSECEKAFQTLEAIDTDRAELFKISLKARGRSQIE